MAMAIPTDHSLTVPPNLSPDSLDTLTELSTILSKLRAAIQSSSSGLPPATPTLLTGTTPNVTGASPAAGGILLKDIPSATDGLKHKLQRARVQVRELPDMNQTIAQQGEEIWELEEKIRLQKHTLEKLKDRGAAFAAEEAAEKEP